MNQTKRRPAGMVAINQQLTSIAGQPATLRQLMACFKTSATLRRAWRNARAGLSEPAQLASLPLPQPAQRPILQPQQPQQPQQPETPANSGPKWSESSTFGKGSWG